MYFYFVNLAVQTTAGRSSAKTVQLVPNDEYFRKREFRINPKANILHSSITEGSVIDVSMPYGDLTLIPVVLISGGVGLTPMMSMLNSLVKQGAKRDIVFIHAVRGGDVHAMKDHLSQVIKDNPHVSKVVFTNQ